MGQTHNKSTIIVQVMVWCDKMLPDPMMTYFTDAYMHQMASIISCDQAALWMVQSVRPSVRVCLSVDQNWAFPGCNSSLNSPMDLKWCIKLDVVQKRCPIVFQSHPSNFEDTQDKKLPTLTRIERFRTVTQVWIPWWIWNNAQSLM